MVTSFYPNQGSLNGGTLITINGYNFSNGAITDNPVRVGYTDCLVQSTSNTQITCLTLPRIQGVEATEDLIVFLRTFEEAVFEVSPRTFTWIGTGLPTLTSYSTYFDSTLEDWVLALTGYGFGTSTTGVELYIDDIIQTVLTVNDTIITLQIVQTLNDTTANIDFYLPIGTPDGEEVFIPNGISLTPMMLSISPLTTSPAGSIIVASVKGVAPHSPGVTLVNQAGVNICSQVTIPQYGQLLCHTVPGTILSQSIRVSQHGIIYNCVDTNGACTI